MKTPFTIITAPFGSTVFTVPTFAHSEPHAKDKEAWVANFADDGVVEDPIGPSVFDPDGKGHRGKAAIAAFWDKLIGPNRVFFDIRESYACGSECANVGSVNTVLPNGAAMVKDVTYTLDVYVYGMLRSATPLGYPAAAAFLQSVVGFILILVTNYFVRKTRPELALF